MIWFVWIRGDPEWSVRWHVRLSYDLWTSRKNLFCQCSQKKREITRTLQRTSAAYSMWMDSKMAHEIRPTQINILLVFSRLTNGLPLWFLIFFFNKFFFLFCFILNEIIIKTNLPVIILHVFIGVILFSCPKGKNWNFPFAAYLPADKFNPSPSQNTTNRYFHPPVNKNWQLTHTDSLIFFIPNYYGYNLRSPTPPRFGRCHSNLPSAH